MKLGIIIVRKNKYNIFSSMKFYYVLVFVSCVWMVATSVAEAQVKNQPYSYQHYQKYDELLYSPNTRMHTATKPFLFKGDLLTKYDSIQSLNQVDSDNIFMRKIFNEHLVEIHKEDHSFYLDFLPDFVIGKEMIGTDKRTTWLNTRGVQVGLNIKDKFTFYANAFENQGVFPN